MSKECPLKRLCEHCNKEFDVLEYSETYDSFVASIMNCPHCGKRNDIWVTVIKSVLYEDEEDITLETQNRIRDLVIKKSGAGDGVIDGSGCDSGDPVDLTLDEIAQGFNYLLDEVIDPLREELKTRISDLEASGGLILEALEGRAEQAEAELDKHRWIPVEEKLPTDLKHVLVINGGAEIMEIWQTQHYQGSNYSLGWADVAFRPHPSHITHWKPVIRPPNKG